jgi:hypothetical protein
MTDMDKVIEEARTAVMPVNLRFDESNKNQCQQALPPYRNLSLVPYSPPRVSGVWESIPQISENCGSSLAFRAGN